MGFSISEANPTSRDLSARLGLNQDEGEKWIVNLIRDTRMDGKLDYQEGTVLMNHPANSVYQQVSRVPRVPPTSYGSRLSFSKLPSQVIERTKGSFFRTSVLRYAHSFFDICHYTGLGLNRDSAAVAK